MKLIQAYVDEPGQNGLTLTSEGASIQAIMADLAWQAGYDVYDWYQTDDEDVYVITNLSIEEPFEESFKAIIE